MTFVGMDTAEMQQVAAGLRARARELHEVVAAIDAIVVNALLAWPGEASLTFGAAWGVAYRPDLEAATNEIQKAAASLGRQIEQQRDASYGQRIHHSDRDLWALTNATQEKDEPGPGWTELENLSVHDPATGFDAVVYRDASGRIIVVFPGTDGAADVATDAVGAAGGVTEQGKQAIALARRLEETYGAGNVSFAGFSLGGRLAALSSLATGERAVTFNAAGVNPAEAILAQSADGNVAGVAASGYVGAVRSTPPGALIGGALGDQAALTGNVTNYQENDFVSLGQRGTPINDAVGQQVYIGGSSHEIDDNGPRISDE